MTHLPISGKRWRAPSLLSVESGAYTSLEFEFRAEDETMNRANVTELHYITAIANITSILQHGILSHTLAAELMHDSVAMPEIQAIRQNKQIPGARRLHEYANLYFDAHNAMLSRVRGHNSAICVLHVDAGVLDLPGVIVTDRNAASGWVRFCRLTKDLKPLTGTDSSLARGNTLKIYMTSGVIRRKSAPRYWFPTRLRYDS